VIQPASKIVGYACGGCPATQTADYRRRLDLVIDLVKRPSADTPGLAAIGHGNPRRSKTLSASASGTGPVCDGVFVKNLASSTLEAGGSRLQQRWSCRVDVGFFVDLARNCGFGAFLSFCGPCRRKTTRLFSLGVNSAFTKVVTFSSGSSSRTS